MRESLSSNGIQIVEIEREDQFHRLRERWNALAEATDPDSVFLRHEWFDSAWHWLRLESNLLTLSVLKDDELIGLIPLVRHRRRYRNTTIRSIEFMTVPDTQVCDVLAASEHHEIVVTSLIEYLRKNWHTWDACYLDKLADDSLTTEILRGGEEKPGLLFTVQPAGFNPALELAESWEAFYARRSRRLKKGNNLVANHLKREYKAIELRWIRTNDIQMNSLISALKAAIEISGRSWKTETGQSLDNPGPGAFIEKLTSYAQSHGWLSLWILELDHRPVAMEYQLIYKGHVHALRGDFDKSYFDFSPGTYLNWRLLERLFDENLISYNMGPGDNAYKMRWAEHSVPLYRATAYSATPRGRLMALIENTLAPFARSTLAKMKGSAASRP